MLVVVQQVIVQRDQSLDGLLHRRQLHQRHLPVLPETAGDVTSSNSTRRRAAAHARVSKQTRTHWKNLKAFTVNPLEENKSFKSSSPTEELRDKEARRGRVGT